MSDQPEALRLANRLEGRWALHPEMQQAAAELRRQHDQIESLRQAYNIVTDDCRNLTEKVIPNIRTERDALQTRLALADSVASAASALSVAHNAEGDDWDEWEALKAALKPWRAQRAIDAARGKT